MNRMSTPPIVLVTACNKQLGDHPFHVAGRKYVDAVRLAGALPVIAPPVAPEDLPTLLDAVHGVLLTGSVSNVHPSHYGETSDGTLLHDPDRDAWTLPLVRLALARGLPLFAICRGAQEANVALGGTLHQRVQEQPGLNDHRAPDGAPVGVQYGPAHPVDLAPGGVMQRVLGTGRITVNSVHQQAVATLAPGLRVEATAPDGLVEAFTLPAAAGFNLCVQWHPEWQAADNPVSVKLFEAFGHAVKAYRDRARVPLPRPATV